MGKRVIWWFKLSDRELRKLANSRDPVIAGRARRQIEVNERDRMAAKTEFQNREETKS